MSACHTGILPPGARASESDGRDGQSRWTAETHGELAVPQNRGNERGLSYASGSCYLTGRRSTPRGNMCIVRWAAPARACQVLINTTSTYTEACRPQQSLPAPAPAERSGHPNRLDNNLPSCQLNDYCHCGNVEYNVMGVSTTPSSPHRRTNGTNNDATRAPV